MRIVVQLGGHPQQPVGPFRPGVDADLDPVLIAQMASSGSDTPGGGSTAGGSGSATIEPIIDSGDGGSVSRTSANIVLASKASCRSPPSPPAILPVAALRRWRAPKEPTARLNSPLSRSSRTARDIDRPWATVCSNRG